MSPQGQTVDVGMGDANLDHPLFDESIQAIEQTILEEHRQVFCHVEASSLLEELRNIATRHSATNRPLATSSRKFALFVQTFAPYFNVLSICTQIRTEWPGCFWGLVQLVFQVASGYALFLEKIANIFEVMASVLPPYHQIYTICKRWMDSPQVDAGDERLTMLMSYAYVDIVRTCLEFYLVFFRDEQRPESRHIAHGPSAFAQWRPLDSRFAQLESRLTHHRRWLEKETESQVQDFAIVEQHRQKYLRFLHRQADANIDANGDLEEHRMAKRMKRVEIVCKWLSNGSRSQHAGTDANQFEYLGSCNWFLDMKKYQTWKKSPFETSHANDARSLQDDWHDRVLFVQAETGYGKTAIARAVVDDLAAEAEDLESSGGPPSTAYYSVNARHSDPVQPDEILRQLALQLLYTHRRNHATLDTVCLLLRKTSFQETATAGEIIDVLSVLLRQHPTFLIIDGLDNCSDEKGFLASLAGLCRTADTRAIVFSRASIKIPLEYQKWASDAPHIVSLNPQHNANVRERFLLQSLAQMADQGSFGISVDRALLSHVAQGSSGSFLWTSILLKFLNSPALSPDERQSILLDIDLLQGLEALYSSIFATLRNRPAHEKQVVADVARWLTFPVHGLCITALRTALSSSIDMSEQEDVYSTDILQAIPQLSFGLIEVTEDAVFFVHQSVREYLQASASQGSEFSLCDESSVHAHLAARCLSYLAYDIPQRPLGGLSPHIRPMVPMNSVSSGASYRTSKSGDSGYKSLSSSDGENALPHPAMSEHHHDPTTASIRTIPFDTNLPFLRYASLCWPIHLSRALAPNNTHPYVIPCPGPFEAVPYIPALSAFLASRLAVTAWVEASFRYSLPPTLTRLVGPLADLKGEIPPATIEGKELRIVLGELNVLSEKLMGLKRGYATSLRENPSLIWQIGDAVGEEYWPVWDGSMGMPR